MKYTHCSASTFSIVLVLLLGIEVLAHLCIPDAQLLEFMPNQDGCRVTVKAHEGFC